MLDYDRFLVCVWYLFGIPLVSVWYPFGIPFGIPLEWSQGCPGASWGALGGQDRKRVRGICFLEAFWGRLGGVLGPSWGRLGRFWRPRWSQNRKKTGLNIDRNFDAFWNRFLNRFWWIFGWKMEPSWHQNGILNRSYLEIASNQKHIIILVYF